MSLIAIICLAIAIGMIVRDKDTGKTKMQLVIKSTI
jgi:hypothetical protein